MGCYAACSRTSYLLRDGVLAAVLSAALASCTTSPVATRSAPAPAPRAANSTKETAPGAPQSASTRKVFGRVVAQRDSEPVKLGAFQWSGTLNCEALVQMESETRGSVRRIDEAGWFEWNLAPGDYTLAAMYCTFKNGEYTLPLRMHFTVVPDENYYIGHLGFDFAQHSFRRVSCFFFKDTATTE